VTSDPELQPARSAPGAEALAALGSPARFALFSHLADHGPQTATQCAQVVGLTPSNCSWHLRALARAGLVERQPGDGDARMRPWRTTAGRFDLAGHGSPAASTAAAVVGRLLDERTEQLRQEHLVELPDLPEAWRQVSGSHRLALQVTPEELRGIIEGVRGLLEDVRAGGRADAPAGAEPVVFTFTSFPHPHPTG
jgi:DNA-binding transcriptional ArsR family regulator